MVDLQQIVAITFVIYPEIQKVAVIEVYVLL